MGTRTDAGLPVTTASVVAPTSTAGAGDGHALCTQCGWTFRYPLSPDGTQAARNALHAHTRSHFDAMRRLVRTWRANADMLAEGNKSEWADPAVGMQRACADQLDRVLSAVSPAAGEAQAVVSVSLASDAEHITDHPTGRA